MTKIRLARTLTSAVMALALVISFVHIVVTFTHLGAGWDRWTAPFLIDTIAIIGKICTSGDFAAATRRAGRAAFWVAGIISLICNVAAGWLDQHYGSMVIGVIVVSAALWGEGMVSKIAPKAIRKPSAPAAGPTPAQKAAATRKANAEAAKKADAAQRRQLAKQVRDAEQAITPAAAAKAFASTVAPISPAPIGSDAAYL